MRFNMNVSDVFMDAVANAGGTYKIDPITEFWGRPNYTTGYMVSLYGFEFKVPMTEFYGWRLNAFIENRREELNSACLGIWEEGDDVYLDVSVWIEDEEKAEAFARENMQLAYWDCFANVAIPLNNDAALWEGRITLRDVIDPA